MSEDRSQQQLSADERDVTRPSRTRVAVVAAAVVLGAAAVIFALFVAFSAGFDSAARKAAKAWAPVVEPGTAAGTAKPREKGGSNDERLTVPGL